MRIADRIAAGFVPLRHDEKRVDLGLRNVQYGLAIEYDSLEPHKSVMGQTVGDVIGATLWRSARKDLRPLPAWNTSWSAQVSGPASSQQDMVDSGRANDLSQSPWHPNQRARQAQSAGRTNSSPLGNGVPIFVGAFGAGRGGLGQINIGGQGLSGGNAGIQSGGPANLGQIRIGGQELTGGWFGFGAQGGSLGFLGNFFGGQGGGKVGGSGGGSSSSTSHISSNPATGSAAQGAINDTPNQPNKSGSGGKSKGNAGQSASGTSGRGGSGGSGGQGAKGGGGVGGGGMTTERGEPDDVDPMVVVPTYDGSVTADERFEQKTAGFPRWASRFPRGWTGIISAGTNEDSQQELWHPDALALVSGLAPKARPDLSTAVVDLDENDKVDPKRRGTISSFMRVVPLGGSVGVDTGWNAISWNCAYSRGFGSGLVTFDAPVSTGDGISTEDRNAAPKITHGDTHAVFTAGPLNDRHKKWEDSDGNPVNSLHIRCDAPFYSSFGDGPLLFHPGGVPADIVSEGFPFPCHLSFDPDITAQQVSLGDEGGLGVSTSLPGAWRSWVRVPDDDDDGGPPPWEPPGDPWGDPTGTGDGPGGGEEPPSHGDLDFGDDDEEDPPHKRTPDGKKPGKLVLNRRRFVGPTIFGNSRPLLYRVRESAFNDILFRPQSWGCGEVDLRTGGASIRSMARHRKTAPVVARISAAWPKVGESCNRGDPTYTSKPGSGLYPGGTANGILAIFPAEVGFNDYSTTYAPGGVTRSSVIFAATKGLTKIGSGIPNPTTGLLESGNFFQTNSASTVAEIVSTTAAGVVDKTRSIPNRTGNVVLAPSALTVNYVPRSDANSDLVNSAVSDDGSVVFASRNSIVIGAAQDTQITSSAAGVAKISDYTGGTAASLVFGAATTSRTRLDCSSTTLQTRLGDSSAYAVHAMKQADLFGASTTKRVRFDPGTPTADSTVTVPKDVTGTMPVMTSVTTNALHKSSGTDGTTVPSQITDDGTDATVGTSLVSTTKTTVGNLLVNKSNQTASSGGSYTVGATVGLVVVDMSALTAGQQFDVVLPSAVTYPGRTEIVKITVVGAATSVLKVSATAGNIEGAAFKNWAGDVRCGAVLVSNGTDWYYAATVGVS